MQTKRPQNLLDMTHDLSTNDSQNSLTLPPSRSLVQLATETSIRSPIKRGRLQDDFEFFPPNKNEYGSTHRQYVVESGRESVLSCMGTIKDSSEDPNSALVLQGSGASGGTELGVEAGTETGAETEAEAALGTRIHAQSCARADADTSASASASTSTEPAPTRNYYDDFTSIDWVRDYLYDISQRQKLAAVRGLSGRWRRLCSALQDWILITVVAFSCTLIAYAVDKSEQLLVDLKRGYCTHNAFLSQQQCCSKYTCASWKLWPEVFHTFHKHVLRADFTVYLILSCLLAWLAVTVTLTTKNVSPLASVANKKSFRTMYSAYGSGVPEVKTILSGFVIRRFLGSYTLFTKTVALVCAIASGMSLGKEGPYVHLSTCVGNICCRMFDKFENNGIERRVILSASAAAGVALSFGSPLGGVLFSLEEVSYYLPGNQLLKTFFCAMMSNLFLRFLDPYGTGKAVLFEASYQSDWQSLELLLCMVIGAAGGVFGACFCKFTVFWSDWFRKKKRIQGHPVREVALVSVVTALLTFTNPYTNISVAELLADLASPCYAPSDFTGPQGLCPVNSGRFPTELYSLLYALAVKIVLTGITFGLKVPAGIYVPSMVIGALFGRLFAMYFQYLGNLYPAFPLFKHICDGATTDGVCVDLGVYAMISAGAFMAGVTRMNVTLATIMFELTSSYNYVLPISIAIAVSNVVAHALEPMSLYGMVIAKNDLPFLDNGKSHDFSQHENDLRHLITNVDHSRKGTFVDVSRSAYVSSAMLRLLLNKLQREGLVDGCVPVLKDGKLVAILPAPELELALDKLSRFALEYRVTRDIQVKLLDGERAPDNFVEADDTGSFVDNVGDSTTISSAIDDELLVAHLLNRLSDFTHIMERSPIILDVNSPLSLVELVFTKLGNRSISVMDNGEFVGFLHKKNFIDYCRSRRIL